MMANQSIIHISTQRGGRPYCGTRRAIMSTTEDRLHDWPRVCVKCEKVRLRYEEIRAKRAAGAKQN